MNWSLEEQVRYEAALDTIGGLSAILSKIVYSASKNNSFSGEKINEIKKRSQEVGKEWNDRKLFNGSKKSIVSKILNTYGPLLEKYNKCFKKLTLENNTINYEDCFFKDLISKKVNYHDV